MERDRIKTKREGEHEQDREAKNENDEKAHEDIKEISFIRLHEPTLSAGDTIDDRPNTQPNSEYGNRPERAQEDTQNHGKDEQEIKQAIQANLNTIFRNWQDFLANLGDPREWFLTKEDYELVKAFFTHAEANVEYNIAQYLKEASDDPCNIHKALQFLVIRKLGTIQLQAHKNRIDGIIQAIQHQADMYKTVAQSLAQVVQSFSNSYKLGASVTGLEIPNVVQDLKAVGVIGILTASLTAIGIEIGNLKNNLRSLISYNEFCIRPCRTDCSDIPPIATITGVSDIVKSHDKGMYNEGIEFGKESEIFMTLLEKTMQLEVEYLEKQIKEGKLDLNKKKNGN